MESKNNIVNKLKFEINRIDYFVNRLIKKNKQAGLIRLTIFFLTIFLFFTVYFVWGTLLSLFTLALGFIIFGAATQIHNNLTYGLKRINYWKNFKVEQLAKAQLDWDRIPYVHDHKMNYDHNFSADLSITGEKSLMHLIDQAVSNNGSKILRKYLTNEKPELQDVLQKQRLIKELLPLQNFRNKLLLNIKLSSKNILNSQKLLNSFKSENNEIKIKKILNILFVLYFLNIVFILGSIFFHIPSFWTISLLAYIAVNWFNIKYISDLYERVEEVEKDLGVYHNIFNYLEKYKYGSNKNLEEFCSAFTKGNTPSTYFKKLKNLNYAFSVQKNDILILVFNLIFPWAFFWGYKFEKIKNEIASHLPIWIEKWNELEAYISLANFAYLNPNYTFPEFTNENCFSGENIAHPLLTDDVKISNSFSAGIGEIAIITGSNMSGKSTFLKTLGINLALAYAGAPVNALKLKTNLFRLFTCINITDSLIDGISFFYAEVKRLKKLLDILEQENDIPVFYLIDEIFKGTNNIERLSGSKNLIVYLSSKNGVGVISTHDLELVKLGNDSQKILNYHFREDIRDDKMYFDYKLKKGGSPTTNALKIMKLGGLPINE